MNICILGTDFFSDNRGCQALGYSAVEMINHIAVQIKQKLVVTALVFDDSVEINSFNSDICINLIKINPKKIMFWKRCSTLFSQCDMVIDFTGGDSFSDIYGKKRFIKATLIKELAIRKNKNFVMGPQTIGPFRSKVMQLWAKHILKRCRVCFVRDALSLEYVKKITGVEPIHTTDVAFALPYERLAVKTKDKKRIGITPSGLLWKKNDILSDGRKIVATYKEYVIGIIKELEMCSNVEIHLIPHVFKKKGEGGEDDLGVCYEINQMFPNTIIEDSFDNAMEAKSVISTMDILCCARMHAGIAAFSSGVPVIPFSYSRKFEGLFHDYEYYYLIDGNSFSTEEAIRKTVEWINKCEEIRQEVLKKKDIIEKKQQMFYSTIQKLLNE